MKMVESESLDHHLLEWFTNNFDLTEMFAKISDSALTNAELKNTKFAGKYCVESKSPLTNTAQKLLRKAEIQGSPVDCL